MLCWKETEIINACCLKPLSVWSLKTGVRETRRKWHPRSRGEKLCGRKSRGVGPAAAGAHQERWDFCAACGSSGGSACGCEALARGPGVRGSLPSAAFFPGRGLHGPFGPARLLPRALPLPLSIRSLRCQLGHHTPGYFPDLRPGAGWGAGWQGRAGGGGPRGLGSEDLQGAGAGRRRNRRPGSRSHSQEIRPETEARPLRPPGQLSARPFGALERHRKREGEGERRFLGAAELQANGGGLGAGN